MRFLFLLAAPTVPSADETFDATNLATSAIRNGGTP